ncbi:putative ABC transporter [Methanocella paludicola SANAE]|uniref:ABC transporter n=1 Tax=Methanocella paludicola (strain DSM 17711 / JCM 13418 / NBRC 101707 / SANAE) TaxID=304371 RepID=D1YVL0_METPS|nr:SufD family Fe-S cluster assembly protein [Methanocella paludicola]BAI60482.1 putative ABC transporter [Methanocella paludicola SANAE]
MLEPVRLSEIKKKAEAAMNKRPAYGNDIDLEKYEKAVPVREKITSLDQLSSSVKERALHAGVDASMRQRSGSYFQLDQSVVHTATSMEGVELMDINAALEKYDWLQDYFFKLIQPDQDKFTAYGATHPFGGYFIRALPGAKVTFPLQACMYIGREGMIQNVHNILIAEEGSELHVITGCTTDTHVSQGLHIGVSEFFIKDNAKLTYTMIHNWAPEVVVRPRTNTVMGKNSVFLSNYVSMTPVKDAQMYPGCTMQGENGVARFNTVVYAPKGSHLDLGSKAVLKAKGCKAELIARTISKGGYIASRGLIQGDVPDIKAHLECRGLLLSGDGTIYAVPELLGTVPGVDLSHEAAVGKIAEEEIQYLMSRGVDSDTATALIVRGFLDVDIHGLPPELQAEIKKTIDLGEQSMM